MALQSLESNPQLSFATRLEDWTCLGQHKRQPEFPAVLGISRANAYTLMRAKGFPTIFIGKRMIVPRDKFIEWMDLQISA